MLDLKGIEQALQEGKVWALMGTGRYWVARRNGQTQLWKTRPGDFRIPIKCGMHSYGEITEKSNLGIGTRPEFDWPDFVISENDPNPAKAKKGK
jgi:hypothetical protein